MGARKETIGTAMKSLRAAKKDFLAATFSYRQLKSHGFSEEEIEKIPSVTEYGEKRYRRDMVALFT